MCGVAGLTFVRAWHRDALCGAGNLLVSLYLHFPCHFNYLNSDVGNVVFSSGSHSNSQYLHSVLISVTFLCLVYLLVARNLTFLFVFHDFYLNEAVILQIVTRILLSD